MRLRFRRGFFRLYAVLLSDYDPMAVSVCSGTDDEAAQQETTVTCDSEAQWTERIKKTSLVNSRLTEAKLNDGILKPPSKQGGTPNEEIHRRRT